MTATAIEIVSSTSSAITDSAPVSFTPSSFSGDANAQDPARSALVKIWATCDILVNGGYPVAGEYRSELFIVAPGASITAIAQSGKSGVVYFNEIRRH